MSFEGTAEQEARISVEHGTQAEGFVADAQGHVTGLKVVSAFGGDVVHRLLAVEAARGVR